MDLIPIEPIDDFKDFLESACNFPISFVEVNHPGDIENENIVFRANEDIESLDDYILFYSVEDTETGLPVYGKCRFLTFDEIELQQDDRIQIYTRAGEDKTTMDSEASSFCNVIYWGLSEAIWDKPHTSFEIMKRGDSYGSGPIINE